MSESHWSNYIHSDKDILLGKPVIKGTRISVELILELYENGWTKDMILNSYPTLTEKSLTAVFSYLSEIMKHEFYFPLEHKNV